MSTVVGGTTRRSVGSIRAVQKSGADGLKTSARIASCCALDRRFGEDHRFFAGRDFGFGLDDVERRHGADLDAGAVVLERLLRELERLALHVEVADRVHQVVDTRCARCARCSAIDCCSCMSEISLFFWLTSSCWRVPSILKLRSSGCV